MESLDTEDIANSYVVGSQPPDTGHSKAKTLDVAPFLLSSINGSDKTSPVRVGQETVYASMNTTQEVGAFDIVQESKMSTKRVPGAAYNPPKGAMV
jgi:hypothetical protein